jgi:hypothetical protein
MFACICILGLVVFVYMYNKRQRFLLQMKSQNMIATLRMENIRNRVSPHFIFNILNREMGNYTDEQAGNMRGLVKLMRRNLELTEQLCVTMAEELDFVNTFINLEREALGDSFILSTSIDAAIHLDQEILPSMMIQIPIENAIKHALKDKEGMKRLWIDIKKTGEGICVKVRDNGGGYRINSANHGTGTGIKVILQTIQLLNANNKKHIDISITNVQLEDKTRPLAQNFDAKPSSGEIFVFTPGGDLRKLPEGATVLDFAFDIHTSLGLTCSGGKVNNRPAAIRDVLHNGDIVEVLTQKNQKPKADWLGFVTTSKARTRIKASLREEHTKNARLGREELERKLKNWKLPLTVDEGVGILCKHFKLRTGTELYASIGTEKIDLMQIKELLQAHLSGEAEEERRAAAAAIESEKRRKAEKVSTQSSGDALIIDEKIGQLDYKLAKCCNPIHGDEIFGFITVGAGITIHRTDCPNAQRLRRNYPYRVLEARWRDEAQGAFRVSIRVVASDTTGMINHIAEVINRDLKLSIRSMNLSPGGGLLSGVIHVEVPGTGMVDMLIHSILRIKGVQKAYRVNN